MVGMSDNRKATTAALDSRAKAALNDALDDLLSTLVVVQRELAIAENYRAIDSFLEALTKYEPWRSHIGFLDLFEVLNRFVKKYEVTAGEGLGIKPADALSATRYREFRDDLRAYLLSIPRRHQLTVELPSMPSWGAGEVRLTDRLTLIEVPIPPNTLANIAKGPSNLGPRFPVSARIDSYGYGARRLNTSATADAISHLKQFFHLFERIEPYKRASSLSLALSEAKVNCFVVDAEYPGERATVELPEQLRRFLWSVSIDESKLKYFDASTAGATAATVLSGEYREARTRDEKVECLVQKTDWITRLLSCPPEWPDAERIRAAVEWSFDSRQSDNETLALIQACIGLEALIGDDSTDEPLTARLADRCAYLLGKGHKDRAKIRKDFKEMYEVRSKVIHGRSQRLNLPDSQQLHFAQFVLTSVITTEANALLRGLADVRKAQAEKGKS